MNRNDKMLIRIIDVQILLKEGCTRSEIAKRLGVNTETVRRHILEFQDKMRREIAFRTSFLWVGIQVERGNLNILDGIQKTDAIMDIFIESLQ